jgi:serine/threonine protein kinase
MSAESSRVLKASTWSEWEGQVVNGVFPLRRLLGRSNHSAVFLTEAPGLSADASIKLVPADAVSGEAQLRRWKSLAGLSHPHLVRLFDLGQGQVGDHAFVFVVMEYAEQTLAEVLPRRALTSGEAQEMLPPVLEALGFLHRNSFAHGQVKPSNIVVVNDRLKLASETVRPLGESGSGLLRTSLYDPPELKGGKVSAPGDVWALGITLVEALTQRAPGWPDGRSATIPLPAELPAPLVDTVRRCLSPDPARRPTIAELAARYDVAAADENQPFAEQSPAKEHSLTAEHSPSAEHPLSAERPPSAEHSHFSEQPLSAERPHSSKSVLATVLLGAIVLSLAIWVGLRSRQAHLDAGQADTHFQTALEPAPTSNGSGSGMPAGQGTSTTMTSANSPGTSVSATSPTAGSDIVLHKVVPDLPAHVRERIRGHVTVTVRVLIDQEGNVVGQLLEHADPGKYFARLARDAAVDWKFAPTANGDPRVWLLQFDFAHDGVSAQATAAP